jgi:hypothetical protein
MTDYQDGDSYWKAKLEDPFFELVSCADCGHWTPKRWGSRCISCDNQYRDFLETLPEAVK